jgi:hypothetical protein
MTFAGPANFKQARQHPSPMVTTVCATTTVLSSQVEPTIFFSDDVTPAHLHPLAKYCHSFVIVCSRAYGNIVTILV